MRHINPYSAFPTGYRKMESGPNYGVLIEEYDGRYVFDPTSLVTPGNPYGVPTFLWIDGDGTTPTIAQDPATVLTATGAPASGSPTSYQYPSGVDATQESYNGTSYRRDNVRRLSPLDTDDVIACVKLHECSLYNVGVECFFGTMSFSGTNGFCLGQVSGFPTAKVLTRQTTGVTVVSYPRCCFFLMLLLDRSTNVWKVVWNGSYIETPTAVVAASMPGAGIGIGASPGAANIVPNGAGVEWCAAWFGDGIYDTWSADTLRLAKRLAFESLGLRETRTDSKFWSFDQNGGGTGNDSGRSYMDHNGRWWFTCPWTPRAGNPNGALLSPYQTNGAVAGANTIVNYNPSATAGWTATGGSLTVVNDAANLATAKAEVWGPNVYRFVNATGAPQMVYPNITAGNSIFHLYVLARYAAGAGAQLGYRYGGVFNAVAPILDGYALTRAFDVPAPGGAPAFAIQIPDGCDLYFIGQSLHATTSGYTRSYYPNPYGSSPWSNEARRDRTLTEHTPVDLSGSVIMQVAPLGWSGTQLKTDKALLPCLTTAGDLLHAESTAPGGWATSDGTVQIQSGIPADGVYVNVWTAWAAALQYVQGGSTEPAVTGAYDGVKGMAGAMYVAPAIYSGDVLVRTVQVRQL